MSHGVICHGIELLISLNVLPAASLYADDTRLYVSDQPGAFSCVHLREVIQVKGTSWGQRSESDGVWKTSDTMKPEYNRSIRRG